MQERIYDQKAVNLHTHSFYCGHGCGTVFEYASAAEERGLEVLGLSEHCPVPDDRWRDSRMAYADLPTYHRDCLEARDLYRGRLTVLQGFECDNLSRYAGYYREHLLGELQVDYLLCGIHDLGNGRDREESMFVDSIDRNALHRYTDRYIEALQSGLFAFGAHPDLFCYGYRTWDADAVSCARAIIECAVDTGVALEINGGGLRKRGWGSSSQLPWGYPNERFWSLAAEYPLAVIANSDAHDPSQVRLDDDLCNGFATSCNISFCRIGIGERRDRTHRIRFIRL